ncbi:MAG: chitobiase/beta-hexosaminidase C-terminal domain-containing protein [Vicinamibacteria bacterium]
MSTRGLGSGDGYVDVVAGTGVSMVGLGNGDTGVAYADIEYAYYLSSGTLRIYESGVLRGTFGSYTSSTQLRVGVEGGLVKYWKDGAVIYTSPTPPSYPLLVDTSLLTPGSDLRATLSGSLVDLYPAPVLFSVPAGTYASAQNVVMSTATAGAAIHYTTDGSDPTPVSPSVVSGGAVLVDQTLTLKARAYAAGLGDGPITAANYSIGEVVSAENVIWTSLVKTAATGNWLVKTGTAQAWDAGAVSTRALGSGDGYVDVVAGTGVSMVGLGNGDAGVAYADIEYAYYLSSGTLRIYESGVLRGTFGSYTPSTQLRIGVEAGVVNYRKDGAVIYTSAAPPSYPLLVDASLLAPGSDLYAMLGGSLVDLYAAPVGLSIGGGNYAGAQSVALTTSTSTALIHYTLDGSEPTLLSPSVTPGDSVLVDHTLTLKARAYASELGAGPVTTASYAIGETATTEPVVWTEQVGTASSGEWLVKAGTAQGWDAGAVSTRALGSGDGYVDVVAGTGTSMVGLGNGDAGVAYADIEYAYYLSSGTLRIYESGVLRGTFGSYTSATQLRIAVEGGLVKYWKDGAVIYTSPTPPSYPLLVDTSLLTPGSDLRATLSGSLVDLYPAPVLFSVAPGTYAAAQNVVMSTPTAGAAIHYTTDGSDPTPVSPSVVSGGTVLVDHTLTLKARAYAAGLGDGPITAANYSIGEVVSAENVIWTSLVKTAATGNWLVKTGTAQAWDAGAVSTRGLGSGDGYVDVVAGTGVSMVGLGNGDAGVAYADIEYAYYLSSGTLRIYESGVLRGTFGSYTPSTQLRIGVEAGVVNYRKDGAVIYTSAAPPSYPLLVDASLLAPGSDLYAMLGGSLVDLYAAPVGLSIGGGNYAGAQSVALTTSTSTALIHYTLDGSEPTLLSPSVTPGDSVLVDHTLTLKARAYASELGAGPVTTASYAIGESVASETVAWTNLVGVAPQALGLVKTGAVSGWNAGAVSTRALAAGDGFVSIVAGAGTSMAGLGNGDTGVAYADIEHAYYLSSGTLRIYESGVLRGTFGSYTSSTQLKIAVEGGLVKYRKDGAVIYTSPMPPSYPLLVDTSFLGTGAALTEVTLTGVLTSTLAATPEFDPVPGTFAATTDVSLTSATQGATIRYTLDGSEPAVSSQEYLAPISVATNTTIKAKAFIGSTFPSETAVGEFQIQAAVPQFAPAPGTYGAPIDVTLTSATPGAAIHYTTDGSLPTEASPLHVGPITVATSSTINARAFHASYAPSGVAMGTYEIAGSTLTPPVIQPETGGYTTPIEVSMTGPVGAEIRYTTDGSEPSLSSTLYEGPFVLDTETYLIARAFTAGGGASDWTEAYFEFYAADPEIAPSGGEFTEPVLVTLSSETPGAEFRYTLDGSYPDQGSTLYTGPFVLSQSATVAAVSYRPGWYESGINVVDFTVTPQPPTITPGGGIFQTPQEITLSTSLASASIVYTLDGSAPDPASTPYTGPFVVNPDTVVKALAVVDGQPSGPAGTAIFKGIPASGSIAAGARHSLAVTPEGGVLAWGANDFGQLGDGTFQQSARPILVPGIQGAVAAAAGDGHSLVLLTTGQVLACGNNDFGQLGDGEGNYASRQAFTPVPGLTNVVELAAGAAFTLALRADGSVLSFGSNFDGELGREAGSQSDVAEPIPGLAGVSAIAAGRYHGLAVADQGVMAWGAGDDGQLGQGYAGYSSEPLAVEGLPPISAVSAGRYHSLAVGADGSGWAWGLDFDGQLGSGLGGEFGAGEGGGEETQYSPVPVVTGYFNPVEDLASSAGGAAHSLFVRSSGGVYSAGRAADGRLGNGTPGEEELGYQNMATPIGGLAGVVRAAAGESHSLALTSGGTIYAWGGNSEGQLGDATDVSRWTPVQITGPAMQPMTAAPWVTPPAGAYADDPLLVTLASSTPGATIHYTLDGTEPDEASQAVPSGGTIQLSADVLLRARSYSPTAAPSGVTEAAYQFSVGQPLISPNGGTFLGQQVVALTSATGTASIRYTLNGEEPTADIGIPYAGPFTIADTATVSAVAVHPTRGTSTLSQVLLQRRAQAPLISSSAASGETAVLLVAEPGTTIRVTLDGSEPTLASPEYTGTPIVIGAAVTVRARAFRVGWAPSDVASETFGLDADRVSAPVILAPVRRAATAITVQIDSATPGAAIHYTLDGSVPDQGDPEVGPAGIVLVTRSAVLKARAFVDGLNPSTVSSMALLVTGAVAVGEDHYLALKGDGTLWAFGENGIGQLGDGSQVDRVAPVSVSGPSSVSAIAANGNSSYALDAAGSVWQWGALFGGYATTPVPVVGLTDITAIAPNLALDAQGQVFAWGENWSGLLGDGTTGPGRAAPGLVSLPGAVTQIARGPQHAVALAPDGQVWAWGRPCGVTMATPVPLPGLEGIVEISGEFFRRFDGQVLRWQGCHDPAGVDLELPGARLGDHDVLVRADATVVSLGEISGNPAVVVSGANLIPLRVLGAPLALDVQASRSSGRAALIALDGAIWTWRWAESPVPVGLDLTEGDELSEDADSDGLPTGVEMMLGTDPYLADTNGDGLADGDALAAGVAASDSDPDHDGVATALELVRGTNPAAFDSDGDGAGDGIDCAPLDPTRTSCPIPDPLDASAPGILILAPPGVQLVQTTP